jgi:hypothetical protein
LKCFLKWNDLWHFVFGYFPFFCLSLVLWVHSIKQHKVQKSPTCLRSVNHVSTPLLNLLGVVPYHVCSPSQSYTESHQVSFNKFNLERGEGCRELESPICFRWGLT